ncbi:MAG: polysaccharide biosynthesis protein, partial [Humibacter sp.]
ISRVVGADGWANFSAGQAVGILGMVGVLFGWGVVGPVQVARSTTAHERAVILGESLRSRALTSLIAVPAAGLVTFFVSGTDHRPDAVLVAIAMALGGLTPAWFCIGEGNPRALLLFDALPKLAASAVALPAILMTGQIIWYPILLIALTLPTFAVHAILVRTGHEPTAVPSRGVARVLASLVPTAAIDAAGNAYGSTPIPIATAGLSPVDASSFASADRVYRVGLLAVIAVGNAFQAWVLDPAADDTRRRHGIAFAALGGLGAAGGVGIALLGPWATSLLFGADVAADPADSALFGLAFLFISCATPLVRNILIPSGRYRLVLTATIVSASVGVSTMLVGAAADSSAVIALGIAAAEAVSFGILVGPSLRQWNRSA